MPLGSEAVCCRRCNGHCAEAVRQCIAAVVLPTAVGNALRCVSSTTKFPR